jgi:prepilin-type N-terminal cleavage/methylation domain-containing protein
MQTSFPGNSRGGVTLIEMLVVVAIIGVVLGISFPAMSAGLTSIRLASASGSVASFLTAAMNNVERREQPAAIVIDPHENTLAEYTAASGNNPTEKLVMPAGITIEGDKQGDEPRRFVIYPGGAFPRIIVALKSDTGGHKQIAIDPTTAVPHIQ